MDILGKTLILLGVVLVVGGIIVIAINKIPGLGRLPGDISIEIGNISCFFPLATSILMSIVLTIVLNLLFRIINR